MRHTHVQSVLPKLRRHAFVLAGDRDRADELVMKCLKNYRAAPGRVRPHTAKVDLFRLFHATARKPAASMVHPPGSQKKAPAIAGVHPEAASLNDLNADQRCVLALVAVEGFDKTECADVLGLPVDQVALLLRQARRAATMKPEQQWAVCS